MEATDQKGLGDVMEEEAGGPTTQTKEEIREHPRTEKMVRESEDPRATALAELKDAEDGDPFRILIGTILSQRTRDERTTLATERLFRRIKGPAGLARVQRPAPRRKNSMVF